MFNRGAHLFVQMMQPSDLFCSMYQNLKGKRNRFLTDDYSLRTAIIKLTLQTASIRVQTANLANGEISISRVWDAVLTQILQISNNMLWGRTAQLLNVFARRMVLGRQLSISRAFGALTSNRWNHTSRSSIGRMSIFNFVGAINPFDTSFGPN